MIRFVDLGTQISDEREFAFYNTVPSCFVEFNGEQIFTSWEHFYDACTNADIISGFAERCKSLCPDWVFNDTKVTTTEKQSNSPTS